jgi:hypothetical protein
VTHGRSKQRPAEQEGGERNGEEALVAKQLRERERIGQGQLGLFGCRRHAGSRTWTANSAKMAKM